MKKNFLAIMLTVLVVGGMATSVFAKEITPYHNGSGWGLVQQYHNGSGW
ncbi:hypothetical protein [Brevibacillus laterosporus]|nr:hypothetical protein [Brevibacillus laterosporus]